MDNFNFRHVMEAVGMPLTNENSWAVGHSLRHMADEFGCEPLRILTKKTNPNPTVNAPHCIAHYPMDMFEDAVKRIELMWQNDPDNSTTQYQLFDERINH